ncbi:MAG: rRNA methyltransferase, partial [Actinomycetes bacterium]
MPSPPSAPNPNAPDPAALPGVGPHPQPWPDDPRLDPQLLIDGDRRNVVDQYRYWT